MTKSRFCEICKQPIDPERVEVLPETHLCTRHAHEIQKFGGEFRLVSHQERTSKAGSLKKNFGGVSTHTVRNDEAMRKLREAQAK
ncbi:MAG: hypothetical protein K8T91_14255, partial [Planctomycetes bacterium]|nr:hypothetical protein [Planctomycetota bacterium]